MKILWAEVCRHKNQLMLALCAGLMLVQFANFVSFLTLNVGHQSVILARDDDAGWGIAKAVQTRWWKDNGWAHYGPLYFRTAHTLQYFLGNTATDGGDGVHEQWERTAHFCILFGSLLSIYLFSFLIVSRLTASWPHRLSMTALLVALGLSNPAWAEMLLRAHPDHMFGLVCGLAFYFTLLWQSERGQKPAGARYFAFSAALWGLAVSVKLSVVLIGPAFLVLFFPPFRRERLMECLRYGWILFMSYFLIGFPQTITLDRPFRFLREQNKLSVTPDHESWLGWWDVYSSQTWKILLALAVMVIFLPQATRVVKLGRDQWWRLLALIAFPTFMLVTRKVLVPSSHYAIPFLVMLFVAFAIWLAQCPRPKWVLRWWTPLLPIFVMVSTVGTTPPAVGEKLKSLLVCRSENRDFYNRMVEWGRQGLKIWIDPYMPYDTSLGRAQQDVSWVKTWAEADRENYQVLALSSGFFNRYLVAEPSEYVRRENDKWQETKAFYDSLQGHDQVTSPAGHVYKKILEDKCLHQVWMRDN